jgi:hypothetical protein
MDIRAMVDMVYGTMMWEKIVKQDKELQGYTINNLWFKWAGWLCFYSSQILPMRVVLALSETKGTRTNFMGLSWEEWLRWLDDDRSYSSIMFGKHLDCEWLLPWGGGEKRASLESSLEWVWQPVIELKVYIYYVYNNHNKEERKETCFWAHSTPFDNYISEC